MVALLAEERAFFRRDWLISNATMAGCATVVFLHTKPNPANLPPHGQRVLHCAARLSQEIPGNQQGNTMRSFITLLAVALLELAMVSAVRAQSTVATLTGTVTDPTSASVPNATVEVTNTKTGYVYTATSNADGVYTVANLLEGTYQIRAKASGFGDLTVNDITLNAREFQLQLRVEW
jgi:hypothetical protein